ncbi:poly polymerase catalytic domain-containing protein [Rhodofomes roseus]|uniref:Poly [ADP-ribose] polymerase n=1 Tax=Rhodofomes roseus TaxID=34475 RepID=A0ABQ8KHN7_9APHY|nr:poly polymerase catalytic domain-containing protein [Rhodofomes roseus]KAH9836809.1 poly polymerase catalytic domain-containing protein [Rhodofomes roseus]
MPPRKKATATDASDAAKPASTRATRSSTRAKAPSSKASTSAAAAVVPAPASKAKTKAKRERAASDEEDEEEEPDAKKAKTGQNGASDDKSGGASQKADPPAKMVTVVKRGAAPVDPCSGWVDTHQVLSTPEGIWDATLNQTDISKNANKFYAIQVLHPVGNDLDCTLFTRWGRVGENGQQQKKGGMSSSAAVSAFKAQFKAKAAVNWEQRHGMVAKKGKYQWIERVFEDEKPEDNAGPSGSGSSKKDVEPEKIPDSTLPQEIQALCRLMFSAKLIDATLSSMNYDANKLPLGKLAKSTILNGFAALKTLSEVISQPDGDTSRQHGGYRSAVEELTGRYYSIIPHVFGRNRPTTIDSLPLLKKELELVDALGDMEVASKLITSTVPKDANGKPLNPLDQNFLSLRLSSMDPIARASKEFGALETYTRETHGATHRHYQVQVLNAFRVERQDETDAWMRAGNDKLADGERLLLWHGSRSTNFAGILSQGLRIAPPEAPVTGYMFGKGVYFADMMSKSANYCHAYLSDNTGILLLCEVAAKPFYEQHAANYNADQDCKAARARCTKGLGRTQPADWQDAGAALENDALSGCHMPKGPGQDVQGIQGYLQYNEYIVYDTSQIRVRYLLMVKMN